MQVVDIDNVQLELDSNTNCFFTYEKNNKTKNLRLVVFNLAFINTVDDAKKTAKRFKKQIKSFDYKLSTDIVNVSRFAFTTPDWLKEDSILTDGNTTFIGILKINTAGKTPVVIFEENGNVSKMEDWLFVASCKASRMRYMTNASNREMKETLKKEKESK